MRTDIFDGNGNILLRKVFGTGYDDALFFNNHCRYRVFCGGRSCKKSKNIVGYETVYKILSNHLRNVMILRQNDSDNRQSTFENIVGCICDLGLENYFKINKNPLVIEYKPTGQQIIFRGLNNPTSLNGVTFAHGYFTDAVVDEAFEIPDYADFRKLDGSIRGKLPDGLFHQITLCMNGWDGECWINEEFFKGNLEDDYDKLDDPNTTYMDYYNPDWIGPFGKGLYLHKSTYKINEFRDKETYDAAAMEMKRKSPRIYAVEFLGCFGVTTGAVYEEFNDSLVIPLNAIVGRDNNNLPNMEFYDFAIGIDIGLSNGEGHAIKINKGDDVEKKIRAATTMSLCAITTDLKKMVVVDEYFHSNNTSDNSANTDDRERLGLPEQASRCMEYLIKWMNQYGNKGTRLMTGQINCYIDCADQGAKAVFEVKAREYGLFNVRFFNSTKISIQSRVDFWRLQMAYGDFVISDKCPNLKREIKNARRGKKGEARADGDDHIITATEYGFQPIIGVIQRWKSFKLR